MRVHQFHQIILPDGFSWGQKNPLSFFLREILSNWRSCWNWPMTWFPGVGFYLLLATWLELHWRGAAGDPLALLPPHPTNHSECTNLTFNHSWLYHRACKGESGLVWSSTSVHCHNILLPLPHTHWQLWILLSALPSIWTKQGKKYNFTNILQCHNSLGVYSRVEE